MILKKINLGLEHIFINILLDSEFKNDFLDIYDVRIVCNDISLSEKIYSNVSLKSCEVKVKKLKKTNSLFLKCSFITNSDFFDYDYASGEHLAAIKAYDSEKTVFIGTKDDESLIYASSKDNNFPLKITSEGDFIKYSGKPDCLEMNIAKVLVGEEFTFKFAFSVVPNAFEDYGWLALDYGV